jgi:hypothetical protein
MRIGTIEHNLESFEPRTLFAATLGSDGWTHFTPSSDTRIIYVSSSSGKDSNSGLSPSSPLKTISKAKSLIRDGKPDWLLLKADDTFTGGIGPWKTSGRSASEMQLIGSYGTGARPILDSGTQEGFVTFGGTGHSVDDVAIDGLQFIANTYNGKNGSFSTTGIRLTRQGTNWLIENCSIDGYKDDITLDGDGSGLNHVTIRRCDVLDAYVASASVGNGHAQGIYLAAGTKNTTIEQNVIDHNGWNEGVAGAGPTEFNHDIYVNTGVSGTIIDGNTISRASLCGITMRSAATITDNLILRCPVGIKVGGGASSISGNVILDGLDLGSTGGGATGIEITSSSGVSIANNIIAHELSTAKYHVTGIRIDSGVTNMNVSGNVIYDWQQAINNGGDNNITINNNQLSALNTAAPLIAQVSAANTSKYHYSGNIYSTPRSGVNSLANSDKSFSAWVSATKETGAKQTKLVYVNPNIDVSITTIKNVRTFSQTNLLSSSSTATIVSAIRNGFKLV